VSVNHIAFLIFSVLFLFSCAHTENDPVIQSPFNDSIVVQMYDAAAVGDTAFIERYATSSNPVHRTVYAKLMASIQPLVAPKSLEGLLVDPIPYVRLYAAFAVGQVGSKESLHSLEKAFKKATIPEIKSELLEAIGKCANDEAMEFLISHNPNTSVEEAGKVWGIYRGMLGGKLQENHLEIIVAHLKSNEVETRLAAANVLLRQKEYGLESYAKDILDVALSEKSDEVKAALGGALASTSHAGVFAESVLANHDSPLVRFGAIQMLPHPEKHILTLENSLISESPWEATAAASVLAKVYQYRPSASVVAAARTTEIPEVRAFIASTLLKSDWDTGVQFYQDSWNYFKNDIKNSVLLSIWSAFPEGMDFLQPHLFSDGPLGTGATMAYLEGIKVFPEWKTHFSAFADRALNEGLLAQTYLFVRAASRNKNAPLITASQLEGALKKFNHPEFIEGYIAIADLLRNNFNKKVPELKVDYNKNDWVFFQRLGPQPTLELYIGSQVIKVVLVPEDAPLSCTRIAKLASDRFYDGTFFHRIVPGFVSQGGGPRGDGFGSDKDLMRSEFSPLKYGSGVVGLASAGKDTESCQFFFTHTSTPHLDGRYTIIGASSDDLSWIETGARIDSVRLK